MAVTSDGSGDLARICAEFLDERKLSKIEILEVGDALQIADYFVLASGRNSRQLKATANELFAKLRELGVKRRGIEGYQDARWILVDLGDVILHLFLEEVREFYDLDSLWGDCPRLAWDGGHRAEKAAKATRAIRG